MTILVERARPSDAAELLAFLKQIGAETDNLSFGGEGLPFTEEAEAAYIGQMAGSRDGVMLVARESGQIIGNASLNRLPRRMSHRGEMSVAVARSHWNRGAGSLLMQELLTFAKENDFELVDLQVRSDNAAAIHLYEKYGFQKLCTYPAFFKIGDERISFDLMRLEV